MKTRRFARAMAGTLVAIIAAACAAPAPAGASAPPDISGLISAVDLDGRTLTIRDPEAGEVTLLVDQQSVVVLDGDDGATLEDLFAGDEVESARVRVLNNGRYYLERAVVTSRPFPAEDE